MRATSTVSSSRRRDASSGPVEATAATLRRLGVRPSRRLGQSFLTDPYVADAEAALLEVPSSTPILEIGGGLGLLTEALLARGFTAVTVIEKDLRLARHLRERFHDSVTVVEADATTAPWPPAGAMVSNLPFSVATPILLRAFAERLPRCVVLVQREVGDRLTAEPGGRAYGRLTILAALYGSAERFLPVPAVSFYPVPAVEGVVLRFVGRAGPLPISSPAILEELLRRLFSERRKKLGNTVPKALGPRGPHLVEVAGWPRGWRELRAERIPPEAYFRLAEAWREGGEPPIPSEPSSLSPLEEF